MTIDLKSQHPLYKQIILDLKSKIESGEYQEDQRIASNQRLADEYGVSLITIKKAISELINEGSLYSRVGKGTFVSKQRKRVDFGRHHSIALVLGDLRSPFFSRIERSIEDIAYERGYNILLSNSSRRIEKEDSQIEHFRTIGAEGLLIASIRPDHIASKVIRSLHVENYPYIMISYVQDPDIYYVGSDHEFGSFLATEHLIKLGYRKIGYVGPGAGNVLGPLRRKGYISALEAHGIEPNHRYTFQLRLLGAWNHHKAGYEVGAMFSALADRPEAVFTYNDLAALGFMQAVHDKGLKVPDDVAIVGFDDIDAAKFATVPLTTIHQPTTQIGVDAFKALLERIEGKEIERRTLFKPQLVVRQSCGSNVASEQLFSASGQQTSAPG